MYTAQNMSGNIYITFIFYNIIYLIIYIYFFLNQPSIKTAVYKLQSIIHISILLNRFPICQYYYTTIKPVVHTLKTNFLIMYKINLWKIYPVAGTTMQQARVFINDSSYKPTAPIWKIIRDLTKSTHRYTFISTSESTKIWSWELTTLKNKVLERYVQHIRKHNLVKASILPDTIVDIDSTHSSDIPMVISA